MMPVVQAQTEDDFMLVEAFTAICWDEEEKFAVIVVKNHLDNVAQCDCSIIVMLVGVDCEVPSASVTSQHSMELIFLNKNRS